RALVDGYRDKLDAGKVTTELVDADPDDYDLTIDWGSYLKGTLADGVDTTFDAGRLRELAVAINTVPEDIQLHARVARIYQDRLKMAAGETPGDWGCAEILAYATLLDAGNRLRLVGQDSGRGTFFHRHAVLHDQKSGRDYL